MEYIRAGCHSYACVIHQRKASLPYLLMLHGFMGDHRVFDHLIEKIVPVCNPVTIDLLGYGQSSKPADPSRYTERRQVAELLQVINHLDIFPLHLHGYSMGGRLALQVAAEHPGLAEGLLLESTTCGISNEQQRERRRQKDEQRARGIVSDYPDFLSRWKELPLFASPLPEDPELVERYHRIQQQQHPAAVAASLRGFGTGTMRPACAALEDISAPVVVMAGSADKKYQKSSPALAERFQRGQFIAVRAGHRIHLDHPEAWAGVVHRLMDKTISQQ